MVTHICITNINFNYVSSGANYMNDTQPAVKGMKIVGNYVHLTVAISCLSSSIHLNMKPITIPILLRTSIY